MKTLKVIWIIIINIGGLFKSIWVILFKSTKKPVILHGFFSRWFAHKHRVKRELFYSKRWDQMGKEHFALPFRPGMWIVCNKIELKSYQNKGLISKQINVKKFIRKSI